MDHHMAHLTSGLVTDELWAQIEPLLPPEPLRPKGGRPRINDRAVLTGILFVLGTGIPWDLLPLELGCGSGMTCWRRLRSWQRSGVWDTVQELLLSHVGERGEHRTLRAALARVQMRTSGGLGRQYPQLVPDLRRGR